jgi:hypothetical protein
MTKPSKGDAVAKFIPSAGDESYLEGAATKVTNKPGLAKNAQLERALPVMADEINAAYEQAELMRRTTCSAFIEVGRLLNVARTQFSSAPKFQTWRKKMIHFSNSHVQRLMSVAKEFGDNEDAALLPFGTLAVLTNTSDELKDKVVKEAKEGKAPTRAEVTAQKKAEQGDPPEGEVTAESMESTMADNRPAPVVEPVTEEWEDAQVILDKPFMQRAAIVQVEGARNPFHAACLVYGIPPFHDGHPSVDLVSNLYFAYCDKVTKADPDNTDILDKLTECHDILKSVIGLS